MEITINIGRVIKIGFDNMELSQKDFNEICLTNNDIKNYPDKNNLLKEAYKIYKSGEDGIIKISAKKIKPKVDNSKKPVQNDNPGVSKKPEKSKPDKGL